MVPVEHSSAEHRELLLELSLLISEQRGVDEIFAAFADHVRHGITFDFASLFVVTADPNFIRSVGQQPLLWKDTAPGTVHRADAMGADLAEELAEGGEYIPKLLVDLQAAQELASHGFERAWVIPLLVDGENYGMLTVAKLAKGRFPEDHVSFLRAAARLLARAVRQDLELARARQTAVRAQAASDLIVALLAHEPFDSIFKRLPALLENGLEVDYIGLVIDKGSGFVLGAEAPTGVHPGLAATPEGDAFIRKLATEHEFLQFRPSADWSASLLQAGYRRGALSFLREGEILRGVLLLARNSGRKFDDDEQRFVTVLQTILSQSLANQRHIERTETEAARAHILNEVALLANAGEAIETIFERLVGLLDQALEVDYLGLLTVTDDPEMMVMVGSRPEIVRPAGTLVSKATAGFDGVIQLDSAVNQYRLAEWAEKTEFGRATARHGLSRSATVLIRQGAELLGMLSLARKNESPFTPDEEAFLGTLSSMLGQSITNQRRLAAAQTQAARNGLLNELAVLLNQAEPPEAFFQNLSAQLKTVVPFDGLALLVAEGDRGRLRVVDSSRGGRFPPGMRMTVADFGPHIAERLAAGDIVVEGPAAGSAGEVATRSRDAGTQRGAVAAIQNGAETVGYFLFARQNDLPFTSEEAGFIELVCVLVGQAIANRRKVEEKEGEAIRSQVLSQLSALLQGGDRVRDHFDDLCEILLQAVGFDFVSVTTKDADTGEFSAIRTHGLTCGGEPLPFHHESIDLVQQGGRTSTQYRTDRAQRPVPAALYEAGFKRAASAAIISPDGLEGIFTVGRCDEVRFTDEEMRFIELVSALLGQAAANYTKAHARAAEALRSRILSELALLLNNGEPIDTHFQRLRELLLEGVGFDFCSVSVRIPGTETFRVMRSQPLLGAAGEIAPVSLAGIDGILATGAFSGQYGPEAAQAGAPAGLFNIGIQRGASFVLTTGTAPEGLLTIARRSPEPFTPDEMAFFEVVASLLANVAANERRIWLTTSEAEDQAIVADAAAAVARETGVLGIIRSLRTAVGRFIPTPFVNFGYLVDDHLLFRDRAGEDIVLPMGPYFRAAMESGQTTLLPGESGTPEASAELERTGIQAHVLTLAKSGGVPTGLLLMGSLDPAFAPSPREERLCRLIADIVGPAMANARAAERSREAAEDQAIVAEAAAAVARETEATPIARSLQEAIGRFIPAPFVRFAYLESDGLVFHSLSGERDAQPMGAYYIKARATGQAVVPSLAEREAMGEMLVRSRAARLQSHILTKADSAGSTVGFLVAGSRDPEFKPGERDLRLCRLIAEIVGPAMANARAAAREREEAEDQAIIAAAAGAVAGEIDPLSIVRSLREAINRFIPRPFVNFGYIDGDYVTFPSRDDQPHRVRYGPRFAEALRDGQVVMLNAQSRTDEWAAETRRMGLEAYIATRALSGGAIVGLLVVGSRDANFQPGLRERRLCRLIANMLGPAMANSRAVERERQEAEDQAIIATAAAAVARETTPLAIVQGLRAAAERFIPSPFVNFGFLDGESVRFPSRDGLLESLPVGEHFQRALEVGQAVVPATSERVAAGEQHLEEMVTLGLQAHVLSRATSGGSVAGLLVVGSRDQSFEPADRELRLCRLIADIAGPAMANARAVERERMEAEDQRILTNAAAAVAASATELELIDALQQPIGELIPEGALIFFYLEDGIARRPGSAEAFEVGPEARHALVSGQTVVQTDTADALPHVLETAQRYGFTRWVYTTANSGGDTLGLFMVITRDAVYQFTERDLRLFRLIADFAAPAIANLRESARRQKEAEEQRVLAEAAAALASGATELELLSGLVKPIRQFVPRARVSFSYIEGDDTVLWDGRNRRPIHMLSEEAIETGQITGNVRDSEMTDASRALIIRAGVNQFCDTAATSAGVPIGLLFVGTPEQEFEFSPAARRMLRLIADIAGPAMLNARENRRRRQEAEDERIVSEIAAIAARSDADELVAALPAALNPLIPDAFALYGFIEGDSLTYNIARESDRTALGADEYSLPLTAVAMAARDSGQGVGSLLNLPPDRPATVLGLQAYTLTSYAAAASAVGMLLVSTTDPEFQFDERPLALLKRVIQVVGPAVESSRAEAERARQAELYSLILRSLSEGVVLADTDGRVLFANNLGRQILRALDPEGAAEDWADILTMLPPGTRENYRAIFERGEPSRGRTSYQAGDQTHWYDYELLPLNDPVMKILGVMTDVTADVRRQADQSRHREQMEQAQRLAALGELIGGVAHELNNPLTAILGFAEVMALSPAAEPLSEELAILQKEALRARNIVRDLLFIVKPGTSEREIIGVEDLVAHIERLRRAEWAQLSIRWETTIETPCVVWGNENQLTQVLLNLITNAEHALAAATDRRISICASSIGERTEIRVSDTGAGMDEATRNRVFEPFFTTKLGHGTGLGLPLSYSIVQSHEGEIRVESEPGVGTTFTITLPSRPPSPTAPPPANLAASNGKTRVLVIDDEPSLRKVCQRLIESMGHECVTAAGSADALELAETSDFDVVLCDYRLASETADDVVAGFKRVAPHLIPRTVIATGATTDAGVVGLTERYGLRLMAKPYGLEELASIIQPTALPR